MTSKKSETGKKPGNETPNTAWRTGTFGVLFAAVLLAGCQGEQRITEGLSSSVAAPTVQWGDYSADLQSRIDAAAASRDCDALQEEFDVADANDDATRARTGHGNAELMTYIDAALRTAGCY